MRSASIDTAKDDAGRLWLRVTLAAFAVTGGVVALAEWGILPRGANVVGAPAIIATLLVDTFLYNEFLVRTGDGIWLLLYGFLFVQSIVVAAFVTKLVHQLAVGEN